MSEPTPTPTPGPWRACHDGECKCGMIWSADGQTLVAVAQGPMHLDDMGPDSVPNRETQMANAKLLASAWTLQARIRELEALAAMPAAAYNELRIALAEKEEADGREFTAHARAWLRQHRPVAEQAKGE